MSKIPPMRTVKVGLIGPSAYSCHVEPRPKDRTRYMWKRNANGQMVPSGFTPEKTMTYEQLLRETFWNQHQFQVPFNSRMLVMLNLYPTALRGDIDNIAKSVLDAMQPSKRFPFGIIKNDNLIDGLFIRRWRTSEERGRIELVVMPNLHQDERSPEQLGVTHECICAFCNKRWTGGLEGIELPF